jgi:hypothetical protein
MSNLSDKEIDRLSREAADSYEPDSSSLSWSRLEQKLTEQIPERPPDGIRFGRINPYIWGPAVVLLAGVSFFFIKNIIYSQHSTRTSQPVNRILPSTSADDKQANGNTVHMDSVSSYRVNAATGNTNAASPKQPNGTTGSAITDKKVITGNQPGSAAHQTGLETASADASDKTADGNANNPSRRSIKVLANKNPGKRSNGSKAIVRVFASDAGSITSNGSASNGSIISDGSPANIGNNKVPANSNDLDVSREFGKINGTSQPPTISNENTGIQRDRSQFSLPLIASSGTSLGKISGNDSLLNKLAKSNAPIPHKTVHVNRSLNFGLSFGPDYTDAGGVTNDQIGNNIGITVGYYLTNKLSVNTGIFYSNKFYWSPGHGEPPQQVSGIVSPGYYRTFAAAPQIEFVNGSANIYELPLTLRYDFAKNEKTKFFANAGLSSYFILKQTYINFFHSLGRPAANKFVDEEQVNYWFGVADLSFGFETEIGKGFSFQAEPFIRLPLKDMGTQNLKLNSYGFLLSFRYAPVLSRSKK